MLNKFEKIYLNIISEEVSTPLEINGYSFPLVEFADDDESRKLGLMFRDEILDEGGMIFRYDESNIQTFWMKNTFVPLLIIFLDENNEVVSFFVMNNEEPRQMYETEYDYEKRLKHYSSIHPAKTAIELNAKFIDLLNLKIGQKINIGEI